MDHGDRSGKGPFHPDAKTFSFAIPDDVTRA